VLSTKKKMFTATGQLTITDNAQNQLLEAERVKEKIRDFESDMWNY
jgi:hypothetical protein